MLPYPAATTREEKMNIIHQIKDRLLQLHGDSILAIGLYGSIAQKIDGPYSDIELRVVTQDGVSLPDTNSYTPFKIEIGMEQKQDILKDAASVDDSWAITAGAYVHLQEIYDPANLLAEIRSCPPGFRRSHQRNDAGIHDLGTLRNDGQNTKQRPIR